MRTWSPGAPHFHCVRLRGWRFVTRDGPIPSLQPPPTTCVCAPVVSAWGQGPWGALAPWGWPRFVCVCVCVCVCVFAPWGWPRCVLCVCVPLPGTRLRVRGFICILLSALLVPSFLSRPDFPLCDNNLLLRWQAFIHPLFLFPAPSPHRKQLSQYGFQSLYLYLLFCTCIML